MTNDTNYTDAPGPDASNVVLYQMMMYYKSSMENARAQSILDNVAARTAREEAGRVQAQLGDVHLRVRELERGIDQCGRMLISKHQGAFRMKRCFEELVGDIARQRVQREHNSSGQCGFTDRWLDDRIESHIGRANTALEMINWGPGTRRHDDADLAELFAEEEEELHEGPIEGFVDPDETESEGEDEDTTVFGTRYGAI